METGYKVSDAMTKKPVEVSEDISIKECAQKMKEHDVGSVLVKKNGKFVGILTEEDLVYKIVAEGKDAKKTKVRDIMVTRLITIEPDKDIYDALVKMSNNNIRRLPVLKDKELVGLLTLKDILKIQPQLFEIVAERYELREENLKPISVSEKEGICQNCGMYSKELIEYEGIMICPRCKSQL